MITNQNLIRPMGCFKVEQRTKDGMFNATSLLRQWNETMGTNKELDHFLRTDGTREFINALLEDIENQQVLHPQKKGYVKLTENENVIDTPKKEYVKLVYQTSRARVDRGGGTWVHPYLFIKFAMWLNPRFELQVIKFVHDQLLAYRDEAGEAYKELSTSIYQLVGKEAMRESIKAIGKALNFIVWNKHEEEMRNKEADEKKLKELFELERKVAALISEGFINTYDDLIKYLRTLWTKKYMPKELISNNLKRIA